MKEKIQQYFDSFPEAVEVFATANEILFTTRHHAQSYADERLEDKTVTTLPRPPKAVEPPAGQGQPSSEAAEDSAEKKSKPKK